MRAPLAEEPPAWYTRPTVGLSCVAAGLACAGAMWWIAREDLDVPVSLLLALIGAGWTFIGLSAGVMIANGRHQGGLAAVSGANRLSSAVLRLAGLVILSWLAFRLA